MLTAAIVLVVVPRSSPSDMLAAFARQSRNMTLEMQASSNGATLPIRWRVESGRYQAFEAGVSGHGESFVQLKGGVLAITHESKQYWEYGAIDQITAPPNDLRLINSVYPRSIYPMIAGQEPENIKDKDALTATQHYEVDGATFDTEFSFDTLGALIGMRHVIKQGPVTQTIDYKVTSLRFGAPGLGSTKYQPPIGYTPAQIPVVQRPLFAGTQIKLGRWHSVDIGALNRKGLVVIFTAPDCAPSSAMAPALKELAEKLDKKNIKMVEVWLGSANLPKRNWVVISDSDHRIEKQFQPPVTPYLYQIDKDGVILGAWAGYAEDQRQNLIKKVLSRFDPQD